MNSPNRLMPRGAEHVWLHRSQWRMVAALVLLLGAVVVLLALTAGLWWAVRPRGRVPAASPVVVQATPVATETVPLAAPSVVELYPAAVVRAAPLRVTLRSPGGTITAVLVRPGERVRRGQMLVRLVQRVTVPVGPPRPNPVLPRNHPAAAREPGETERLRRRLRQVRSEVERAGAAAAERPAAGPVPAALQQTEAEVARARQALAAATGRRQEMDRRYEARAISRFQFHLARSAEIVAQVNLRRAEEEEADAWTSSASAQRAPAASARTAGRLARLEEDAQRLEARLARVPEGVAGYRERLPAPAAAPPDPRRTPRAPGSAAPPAPPSRALAAQAPRTGVVAAMRATPGEAAPRGAALLQIVTPSRTRARARVPLSALPAFRAGARVTLREPDGRTQTGRVARAQRGPAGAGLVEVVLPAGSRLGDGVVLASPSPRPLPQTIPRAALVGSRHETEVWVVVPAPGTGAHRRAEDTGRWLAQRRAVRIGGVRGSHVAVASGLQPGDQVIVAGNQRLHDGQPVAPVEIGALR